VNFTCHTRMGYGMFKHFKGRKGNLSEPMEWIISLIDFFLHLDQQLNVIIRDYGLWTYLLFFVIIFCETGLVVTPFLPGDSLLFAAGSFAALGALNIGWLAASLSLAAIAGDSTNYWIGRGIGAKLLTGKGSRFINKAYLDRTHSFYEKYGRKTIILARFVPIVRTFAPFVAGLGKMRYSRFITFSVVGSICWIPVFVLGGFYFGNIPVVKRNFTLVIFTIIIISVLPAIIEFLRQRMQSSNNNRKGIV
jgi:membrane-associated protein